MCLDIGGNYVLPAVGPGGANGQVQYNDNGAFGGDPELVWDDINKRLGVGTGAPSSRLHIDGDVEIGTGAAGVDYRILFDGENSDGTLTYYEDENLFEIDTDLRIDDSLNAAELRLLSANTAIGAVDFGDTDDADVGRLIYDHAVDAMTFVTNTGTRMTITSGGNVGIGITPSARLHVDGGDIYLTDDGNNPRVLIGDTLVGGNYGFIQWDSTNDYMTIGDNGTNIMRISGNNLQMGNVFPSHLLGIAAGATEYLRVETSGVFKHGDIAGSNYTQISNGGVVTLVGTARVDQLMWIGASGVQASGAQPATLTLNAGGWIVWSFADNLERSIQYNLPVPYDADLSADMQLCVGWSSPTTSANCDFEIDYLATALNDSTVAAGTSVQSYQASSGTANGLVVSPLATITGGTLSDERCIHVVLTRDGNDAGDTLNDVMHVHGVALVYKKNKLGT